MTPRVMSSRDQPGFSASKSRLAALLVVPASEANSRAWRISWLAYWLLISFASSLLAYQLNWIPHDSGSIYDISSGFSPYLRSLLEHGQFVDTETVAGARRTTMRLPAVPVFHALLSQVLGRGVLAHVLAKNLIAYGLSACAMQRFAREHQLRALAPFALFALVFLNPVGLRTLPLLGGEESYYIPLLVVLLVVLSSPPSTWHRPTLHGVGIVLAILCLTKSTLSLLAVVLLVFVARYTPNKRSALIPAAYVLVALGGWSVWSYQTTQHVTHVFNISSYDGINLYKGNNEYVQALYPDVHLDVLDVVGITTPPRALRADEWAVNDHFRRRATDYLLLHPWRTVQFLGFKAAAPFLLANSPARIYAGADTVRTELPAIIEQSKVATVKARVIASALWLYKLSFLASLVWAARNTWRRRYTQASVLYLALTATLAVPFVIGFAYVNHLCALYTLMFVYAWGAFFSSSSARVSGRVMTRDGQLMRV